MGESQTSLPPSSTWWREELGKKASREWTEAKLEAIAKDTNEAKGIALSAKRKADTTHTCLQIDAIGELRRMWDNWKNVKLGAIVSVVLIILGGGAQYFALKYSVESNQKEVSEVKHKVGQIERDVGEVRTIVEYNQRANANQSAKDVIELKQVVKDALVEFQAEAQPSQSPTRSSRPRN